MRPDLYIRGLWHRLTNNLMSRCRVCGSSRDVLGYDPRGLHAFFRRTTYCPQHCPDHDYAYDRGAHEWCCQICQDPAPHDFWAYHND
jgi:hypothetical protein